MVQKFTSQIRISFRAKRLDIGWNVFKRPPMVTSQSIKNEIEMKVFMQSRWFYLHRVCFSHSTSCSSWQ